MSDDDRKPARGYSWKQFEPGNTAAVRHGAWSLRLVSDAARELLAELQEAGAPWLADVDQVLLDSWAFAVVQTRRLRAYVDSNDRDKGANDLLLRWERRLDQACRALGFDPLSRAQLGRDTAVTRHLAADVVQQTADAGRELRLRALGSDDASGGGDAGVADRWLVVVIAAAVLYVVVASVVLAGRVS